MKRDEIADLVAFVVVAEARSFTRAAQRLGMAQSALSQIVRRTEERLGLRLLTRTTRSVVPTDEKEEGKAVRGALTGSPLPGPACSECGSTGSACARSKCWQRYC